MTVILVLLTFASFLLIDHFYSRDMPFCLYANSKRDAAPRLAQSLVGGFKVPEKLRFHPGHTWALSESPSLVRVGMDDFASKLVGKVDRIALPQRGQWIRQGQKIWTIFRDGASVDMVSPIEGSIADVNDAAMQDPELGAKGSVRGRLACDRAGARRQDQFPQLAWRSVGALVDRRVGEPSATQDADGARSLGPGWRRGCR